MTKQKQLYDLLAKQDNKQKLIELLISDNEFWSKDQAKKDISDLSDMYSDQELDNYIKLLKYDNIINN